MRCSASDSSQWRWRLDASGLDLQSSGKKAEPPQVERAARYMADKGYERRYDIGLEVLKELPYHRGRDASPEDRLRFHALRLGEVGMIKSTAQKIIAQGTDWRFFNELRKELEGMSAVTGVMISTPARSNSAARPPVHLLAAHPVEKLRGSHPWNLSSASRADPALEPAPPRSYQCWIGALACSYLALPLRGPPLFGCVERQLPGAEFCVLNVARWPQAAIPSVQSRATDWARD
jgi:hypothetical protein